MPTRAPRRCTRAGCAELIPCPRHARPARPRPTRQQLGYDTEWLRISADYRRRHPWCEDCGTRPSEHTDHIDGDVTNRDESNLAALCVPCHSRKTVELDGGFGNKPRRRPGEDLNGNPRRQ